MNCSIAASTASRPSCQFYIRARTRKVLQALTERVIHCAEGAALMTGARMSYHAFENSFDDLVCSEPLRRLLKQSLQEQGVTGLSYRVL